ncbi:MAG TPA: low molecular weight phosphatase family protein [Anaerolineaceae bacterium]|nr:MAG: protein tyrosine phosphatase [Chloroflexi bacterium GWB2_54_36]HAL17690.1 low molecular weight phosphatase family protein [Anaerolineaceae bacterium]
MPKTRVLFLCTGNSARSQMAEAILRKRAGDYFEVYSAGLEPKGLNSNTLRVLNESGIDTSELRSKALTEFIGKQHFGYLITVCSKAEDKCPIFPGMGMRLHWPFDDPADFHGNEEETLAVFREVRDQIDATISEWLGAQGVMSA